MESRCPPTARFRQGRYARRPGSPRSRRPLADWRPRVVGCPYHRRPTSPRSESTAKPRSQPPARPATDRSHRPRQLGPHLRLLSPMADQPDRMVQGARRATPLLCQHPRMELALRRSRRR